MLSQKEGIIVLLFKSEIVLVFVVSTKDVPIGGGGGVIFPKPIKAEKVGHAAGTLGCIRKFDQIQPVIHSFNNIFRCKLLHGHCPYITYY